MSFPTRPLRKEASVKKEQQNENVKEKEEGEEEERRNVLGSVGKLLKICS